MGNNSGDSNSGNSGNDPIPFAAPIPTNAPIPTKKKENMVPVAIAAFVGALAGAIVGSQLM